MGPAGPVMSSVSGGVFLLRLTADGTRGPTTGDAAPTHPSVSRRRTAVRCRCELALRSLDGQQRLWTRRRRRPTSFRND